MLLSHTAGFAHEAPYGSNFDHPAYSFEKHIASISDTWLKFPVGTRYSYSNLGIDLAGYILQMRSGMPFIQYVQEKVLDPLGMKNSTLDVSRIRSTSLALSDTKWRTCDLRLISAHPSGGVGPLRRIWLVTCNSTSTWVIGREPLIAESLAETMYTPPSQPAQMHIKIRLRIGNYRQHSKRNAASSNMAGAVGGSTAAWSGTGTEIGCSCAVMQT
jgi:CubicO group peptidase (beta-lactamase class C family)